MTANVAYSSDPNAEFPETANAARHTWGEICRAILSINEYGAAEFDDDGSMTIFYRNFKVLLRPDGSFMGQLIKHKLQS